VGKNKVKKNQQRIFCGRGNLAPTLTKSSLLSR